MEFLKAPVDVVKSLSNKRGDVIAGRPAVVADGQDLTDLGQGETAGLGGLDEAEAIDDSRVVVAVATGGAARRGQEALAFVEAQGLDRQTGAGGDIADQHANST